MLDIWGFQPKKQIYAFYHGHLPEMQSHVNGASCLDGLQLLLQYATALTVCDCLNMPVILPYWSCLCSIRSK